MILLHHHCPRGYYAHNSSVIAAAVENKLLHRPLTHSTHHLLPDPSCFPWQDEARTVLVRMERKQRFSQRRDKSLFLHISLPFVKLVEAVDYLPPMCSNHLNRSPADESPAFVAAIEAEHSHDFLHYGVLLNCPPVLHLRMPHAL